MKISTDKILTTHVGSLPRSKAVTDGVFAKENEQPYDVENLAATISSAVDEVVRKQVETGVDIVSDGEMSKISYATYIKDRITWRSFLAFWRARRAPAGRPVTKDLVVSAKLPSRICNRLRKTWSTLVRPSSNTGQQKVS
jgi:hypothetical protein